MRYLDSAGFPVPEMIALEAALFDQPCVIMERIAGQTLLKIMQSTPESEREGHFRRFCECFARLHEVDWRPLVAEPELYVDERAANRLLIERYRQNITMTGMTCAAPVLDWVTSQQAALVCAQPSIVHQDFHPDNMIWTGHELKVIDWTAIAVHDRRIDLAWTLMLVGSFLGPVIRAQVLHLYETAAKTRIEHLEVFEAVACVRRFNDLWQTMQKGAAAWGMRPETAAAMRAHAEQYQKQYARLRDITGLSILEIEELITSLSA
jgi:aminoglycoside phosphotransferase (APT) family kinase protein